MSKSASRLVNLQVKNIAAVGSPANRRRWLVVKAETPKPKAAGDAMTFDDAMMGRRLYKVYMALSEQYGALMETMDSIRVSDDSNKGAAVKAALNAFMESMQASVPKMLASVDEDDAEVEKNREVSPTRMTKIKALHKVLGGLISEGENMDTKKTDATALQRIGNAIAAAFGRMNGADEAVIAALEKGAEPPVQPVSAEIPPAVAAQLAKAETATVALQKANEDLQARLVKSEQAQAKLHEEAELRKFAEEVAGYKDLGLDPAKDNVLLKNITEKLPAEDAARIRELFKSLLAQKAATALLTEVGSAASGRPSPESAMAEVDQKVSELMAKSDKLTREQALSDVFRANPSLYERHRAETTVRV